MSNNTNKEFSQKTVLITGGAGGVGLASAKLFKESGAKVFIGDINREKLDAALEVLSSVPGESEAEAFQFDVSFVPGCEAFIKKAANKTGRIDVLVNTAGIWVEGPSEEMTEEQWDKCLSINLKGTFFCCKYAIPHLKKTKGAIINISSDAGVVGTPETALYTASKGGVSLISKSLALELAPWMVRVNAVCPSDIMSPMLEYQAKAYGGGNPEAYFKKLLSCYPQKDNARFISPDEVASLVVYLASDKAQPITGANISIDFGSTAGYF